MICSQNMAQIRHSNTTVATNLYHVTSNICYSTFCGKHSISQKSLTFGYQLLPTAGRVLVSDWLNL